ncbi:hypothetical protein AVEN_210262-1 [Araneus ventricosus]|uniref:Uncharacterized protein n=1 Tax=Araneus ventricosus TaxID=182803 RepID=A0A4Y2HXA0_ARAVE|nr:hypothetical protein AVEN_210262-1 [Araneus ventricosus]
MIRCGLLCSTFWQISKHLELSEKVKLLICPLRQRVRVVCRVCCSQLIDSHLVENLGTSDAPVEALTVDIRCNRISNPRFFGKEESWVGNEESWVGNEESWVGNEESWVGNEESWVGKEESWVGMEESWIDKEESWVGKEESWVSNWSPLSWFGYKTRYSKTPFIRLSRVRHVTTHK